MEGGESEAVRPVGGESEAVSGRMVRLVIMEGWSDRGRK